MTGVEMNKKQNTIPRFVLNAFYESKFQGNLFVIKAGGKVVEDPEALNNLIGNCRELTLHGIKVLLIYGGGRAMDEESARRGIEVRKQDGLRINAAENINVLKHVVGGDLSLAIAAAMAQKNLNGLSLNAVPHDWMDVFPAPKTKGDEFTGGMGEVNKRPIDRAFRMTNFIACACIGVCAPSGDICNINADRLARQLAIGVNADKLIFLSDVDGVLIDGHTLSMISSTEIKDYIKEGQITGGMKVKLENCLEALDAGVKRIHLINGLRRDSLKSEIYESVGPGTLLIRDDDHQAYMNEMATQKLLATAKTGE